jgi:hypothetical protein
MRELSPYVVRCNKCGLMFLEWAFDMLQVRKRYLLQGWRSYVACGEIFDECPQCVARGSR